MIRRRRQRRQRRDGMTEGQKGGRESTEEPKDGRSEGPKNRRTEEPKDGRTEEPKNRRTEGPKDGRTEEPKDGRTEEPKNRRTRRPLCKREEAAPMQPSLLANLPPPHRRSSETQTATSSLAGVKPRRLDLWQEQQLAMKRRGYDNNEMGQHAAQ